MQQAVVLLFALLLATTLVSLLVLYLRYATSPSARWRRRVRVLVKSRQGRLRVAEIELARAELATDFRRLRSKYLDRYLHGIPAEELVRYPGIGPVTISRLSDAGFKSLGSLDRADVASVPGIGPAREKDLRKAVRQALSEAESRFDAGACPESTAFLTERREIQESVRQRRSAAERSVRDARAALDSLAHAARVARQITFLRFLFKHQVAGLTPELLARPLEEPTTTKEKAVRPPELPVSILVPEPLPEPTASLASRLEESNRPPTAPEHADPETVPALPEADTSPPGLLRTAARFGLAVARADGRISATERRQVRTFLERRFADSAELRADLDRTFEAAGEDVPTLGDALWEVKRAIPADRWPELYQLATAVLGLTGGKTARKNDCLARVAEELGINTTALDLHAPQPVEIEQPERPDPTGPRAASDDRGGMAPAGLSESECRAALDIERDTPLDPDLIRRQYRLLSDRFAPHRFIGHGPDFMQLAVDRLARVQQAARQLLANYNEPLDRPTPSPPADLRHNPDLDEVFGA